MPSVYEGFILSTGKAEGRLEKSQGDLEGKEKMLKRATFLWGKRKQSNKVEWPEMLRQEE